VGWSRSENVRNCMFDSVRTGRTTRKVPWFEIERYALVRSSTYSPYVIDDTVCKAGPAAMYSEG